MLSVLPPSEPVRVRKHGDGHCIIRALDRGIRNVSLSADDEPRTLTDSK